MSKARPPKQRLDDPPKSRMIILLGVLLFAGCLLTTTISYLVSRNSIRSSILENELPLSSDNIYSEIQRDLFEPILISSLMANDTFVKDWITSGEGDIGAITRYLEHIRAKYGATTAFLVSERTRRYYNSREILKVVHEENPADAWYFRVRTMDQAHEMNVDPDMSNDNTMAIFVNFRIVTRNGEYLGATGIGLAVNALKNVMQEYRTRYHRDVFFYNRAGEVVLHSLGIDNSVRVPTHQGEPAMQAVMEQIAQGDKTARASVETARGTLANYRYLPELDWVLVVEQAHDGTLVILLKTFGFNLLICFGISIVLLRLIQRTALRNHSRLSRKNRQLSKRKTALQQANHARERLFAIIGHDLREPIANLKSSLDLLEEGTLDTATYHELQSDLRRGVDHALVTLENLMEWGALQSNSLRTCPREINLHAAAESGIQLLRLVAKEKGVALVNRLPADTPAYADLQQTKSILRNLLSNAIKFTPPGGRVTCTAERTATGPTGDDWRITVRDTGVGIPPARAAALTDIKAGASEATAGTGDERGLGLGLQLCRDFIRGNGGLLTIESTPGNGSAFSFTLPAHKNPQ